MYLKLFVQCCSLTEFLSLVYKNIFKLLKLYHNVLSLKPDILKLRRAIFSHNCVATERIRESRLFLQFAQSGRNECVKVADI